jgi:hypothetical protein
MNKRLNTGLTLVEILIAVSIFVIISIGIFTLGSNTFTLNGVIQNSFSSQEEVKNIIKPMVKELRTMSISNLGENPISQAATSSITFFSDVDADGLKEKIRYFQSGTILKKGIIKPGTNPISYSGTETVSELIHGIKNGTSTPIFEYYDSTYTGTSSPLTQPVSLLSVRLVKINIVIGTTINGSPISQTITTQVSLRNLKDNL